MNAPQPEDPSSVASPATYVEEELLYDLCRQLLASGFKRASATSLAYYFQKKGALTRSPGQYTTHYGPGMRLVENLVTSNGVDYTGCIFQGQKEMDAPEAPSGSADVTIAVMFPVKQRVTAADQIIIEAYIEGGGEFLGPVTYEDCRQGIPHPLIEMICRNKVEFPEGRSAGDRRVLFGALDPPLEANAAPASLAVKEVPLPLARLKRAIVKSGAGEDPSPQSLNMIYSFLRNYDLPHLAREIGVTDFVMGTRHLINILPPTYFFYYRPPGMNADEDYVVAKFAYNGMWRKIEGVKITRLNDYLDGLPEELSGPKDLLMPFKRVPIWQLSLSREQALAQEPLPLGTGNPTANPDYGKR